MLCRLLHKSRMNEVIMSILNVEHLNHGFGDRAILKDVTFRLLKGEHVGFVGANGEGKSTFMNIITGMRAKSNGPKTSMSAILTSMPSSKKARPSMMC